VLELEDLEDGALDLDVIAVLELVRADDGRSAPSRAIVMSSASNDSRRERGSAAFGIRRARSLHSLRARVASAPCSLGQLNGVAPVDPAG
jgi:hypothetical protein